MLIFRKNIFWFSVLNILSNKKVAHVRVKPALDLTANMIGGKFVTSRTAMTNSSHQVFVMHPRIFFWLFCIPEILKVIFLKCLLNDIFQLSF